MRRRACQVRSPRLVFAGFRFPPDVIIVAVRWYLRYTLSYRDVEELGIARVSLPKWHCCIKAKGVLATPRSVNERPLRTLETVTNQTSKGPCCAHLDQ